MLELGDLGALRAVDVAARVVLEQVEHGLDAHLGETARELGADRLQLGDAVAGELAERESLRHRRSAPERAASATRYSTPTRYG